MPNPNTPSGFKPTVRQGGTPFSVTQYAKGSTDPNPLYNWDMVIKIPGAGILTEASPYQIPTIQTGYTGTPGTTLWLGSSIGYGAASALTMHSVTDEVDAVFLVQAKTGVNITNAAHAGKNGNISLSVAGDPLSKSSRMQIDSATIAASAALDCRIRAVAMIPPNAEGDSAVIEVMINKHFFGQATPGV
jgi:hypothetical protein